MTDPVAPRTAPDAVPIRMLDAGSHPGHLLTSDREALRLLREAMITARSAATADGVVLGMVDLVSELMSVDAVTIELRGPAGQLVPWLVAHRGLRPDEQARLVDADWRRRGPARFADRLSVELTGAGARPGVLTVWRAEGAFDAADAERVGLAGTTIETLLHQFLRRLKGQQRQHWLDTAEQFFDALVAPDSDAEDVLRLVADQVREVAQCDLVWLVSGSGEAPVLRALSGADVGAADLHAVDMRASLTAQTLQAGEPLRVMTLPSSLRTDLGGELRISTTLGPAIVQPVRVAGRVVGGLGVAWEANQAARYLSLDPRLPEGFAARAALAIRISQARKDDERLAVLEERHRIRLDLHDRVVQRLYALGMSLETARLHQDATTIDALLDGAVERVDETLAELRRTIAGLSLADQGLLLYDAVVDVLDRVAAAVPFRPELRIEGLSAAAVPPAVVDDLLSVLEEAVSNVIRHAHATRCRVTLEVDGHVRLTVQDDGVGIPAQIVGSGLANIRHRAAAHAGNVTIHRLDPGTRLTWTVPRAQPLASTAPQRDADR